MDRWEDVAGRLEKQRDGYPVDETSMDMLMKALAYMSPPTELDDGTPVMAGTVGVKPSAKTLSKAAFKGDKKAAVRKAIGKKTESPKIEYDRLLDGFQGESVLSRKAFNATKKAASAKPLGQEPKVVAAKLAELRGQSGVVMKEAEPFTLDIGLLDDAPKAAVEEAVASKPGMLRSMWNKTPKKTLGATAAMYGVGKGLDMLYPDFDPVDVKLDPLPASKRGLDANGKPLGKVERVMLTPEQFEKRLEELKAQPFERLGWK